MINAIAIDDEYKALNIITNHAAKVPFLNLLATFTNPFEALAYLQQHKVEVIFLDIKMPDISGIELLKAISQGKHNVIFTTAHSEYALESYELEALDYLLKPFDFTRFLRAVTKAQEKMTLSEGAEKDFFFVNTGYQQRKINYNDICFVEGSGNYVTYYTEKEKIMVRTSMRETIEFLPANDFIQIHRSSIISLKKLDKIQDNHAFIGNQKIPIGANYREELMRVIGLLGILG